MPQCVSAFLPMTVAWPVATSFDPERFSSRSRGPVRKP